MCVSVIYINFCSNLSSIIRQNLHFNTKYIRYVNNVYVNTVM